MNPQTDINKFNALAHLDFKGEELAAEIWQTKYALKQVNKNTKELTLLESSPSQMWNRMALEFSSIEQKLPKIKRKQRKHLSTYGKKRFEDAGKDMSKFYLFQQLLFNFSQIIPGGSVMSNLGSDEFSSTSNCFFVALEDDSLESIFKLGAQIASIFKYRGGCGIDITKLRPKGAIVNNSAKTSTGAVSFMPLFSEIARVVGQDGRRAAMMISIDISHPDVVDFITIKQEIAAVTGANISVKMNKEFLEAVHKDENFLLTWSKSNNKEALINLKTKVLNDSTYDFNKLYITESEEIYFKKINARELFEKLVKASHKSAEPGILFWDTTLDYSLSSYYSQYQELGTNPCGEIPLGDKDACRLFAINLAELFTGDYVTDEATLYELAYNQLVMADYLVDLEDTKIQKILNKIKKKDSIEYQLWDTIRTTAKNGRRLGCGITGLFDYIAKIVEIHKITNENIHDYIFNHVDRLFEIKLKAELDATIDLAIIKGSFKGYDKNENSLFVKFIEYKFPGQYKRMLKFGRRNVSFSTIAPTGSISILAGVTNGIEPLFAPYYTRKKKVSGDTEEFDFVDVDGEKFTTHYIVHPMLKRWANTHQLKGSWEDIFKQSPYYGWTSADIPIDVRLKIQSIAQRYTTHSISSTLNLPKETSVETIADIFMKSYHYNLKGVTVYREGSRGGILETIPSENKDLTIFKQYDALKRPKLINAEAHVIKSKGDVYAVVVGLIDNKPYEIFAALCPPGFKSQLGTITKMRKGSYKWIGEDGDVLENLNSLSEFSSEKATTLYISMLLRTGAKLPFVIKVAKKADGNIASFTSAICRVLSKYLPKETIEETCPDCGGKLIREAGCVKCTVCPHSICLFIYET